MANRINILKTTIHIGDTIKVQHSFEEKGKKRSQIFTGIVIRIKGKGVNKSFTVRKIASGAIGVERIWAVNSPWLEKIKVVHKGKVKRAKLYYLRERAGKKAIRVKIKKNKKTDLGKPTANEKEKSGKPRRKPSPPTSSK